MPAPNPVRTDKTRRDSKLKYFLLLFFCFSLPVFGQGLVFQWLHASSQTIEQRVPLPRGYARVPVKQGSFQDWLRHLPLKPGRPELLLYDRTPGWSQSVHYAVIDLDVPRADLQQCADSIIRLRAEYLYSIKDYSSIHFNFTSGDEARFDKYAQGYRPLVVGNSVRWLKIGSAGSSYQSFRNYLTWVFRYAGTYSLSRELDKVQRLEDMQIGDIFIRGGFPGHAMIVVDMAENPGTKEKIFLLAQGFNPAVEMHVVVNPNDEDLSPWYPAKFQGELITPQYVFSEVQLVRFPKSKSEKDNNP